MNHLIIEYCVIWNYLPRAASLAEKLKNKFDIEIELKKSDGGRFEISLNGEYIFSKYKEFRFPEEGEIEKILEQQIYQ